MVFSLDECQVERQQKGIVLMEKPNTLHLNQVIEVNRKGSKSRWW